MPAGVDQRAIHLHGAEGEGVQPLQTGVAGAVIIHGQGEAELLEGQQALPCTRVEIELLVFADLQHDLAGLRPPGVRAPEAVAGAAAARVGAARLISSGGSGSRSGLRCHSPSPGHRHRAAAAPQGLPSFAASVRSGRSALPGSTGWPPAVRLPALVRLPARVRRAISGEGRWAPGYPRSRSRRRPQRQAPPSNPAPLRGAAAQGVPPGAGAVPGRGGAGS